LVKISQSYSQKIKCHVFYGSLCINKQYKTLKTHHTPALALGHRSASSINRRYINIAHTGRWEFHAMGHNVMWSSRWHYTNRSITRAPYNIKVTVCHTARHNGEEYDDWNRRRKSIPCSSSSHREGSITQHGASCGWYNQRRRWSTPKTLTWTYDGSLVEGLSEVWWRRAIKAMICKNTSLGTEFSPELSASHGGVDLRALTSSPRTWDERRHWRKTAAVVTVVRKCSRELSCSTIVQLCDHKSMN